MNASHSVGRPRAAVPALARPLVLVLALLALLPLALSATAQAQQAATPGATPGAEVELQDQVFDIARQLRCPTCTSESVGDSSARISIQIREQIQEQLEAGRSEAEILAFFQERYGDWILLEPPRRGIHLVVWLLPAIAVAAGAGGLAWLIARWMRTARQPIDASGEDLARVRTALAEGRRQEDGR